MSTTNAATATVYVRLFGAFSVHIDGSPVQKWRAGKARSLFQYLLMHSDRVILRDKLYEVLWPQGEWSPNSSSLKVAMHALRQILRIRPDGNGEHGVRIVHQDFGYVLHAENMWVDVDQFERLIDRGRDADRAGDTTAAMAAYSQAMHLYQGDFLAGDSADWIVEQRQWCKSLALRALDRLTTESLGCGDIADVARWCRRIVELDPYREETYQLLMTVHGKFGELGTVRRWHDICTRRLRDELGVRPSSQTEWVYVQAMRGELRQDQASAAMREELAQVMPMPRNRGLTMVTSARERDVS
ncbi:winged helix-turn-helix domain-containing protein [Kibdelosporangium philippinense]|uniref:Winged helix-turn-helix domain-containing protein n=1 Tax=Kibdelosporangium philippinense TaxID=211113 RepID=A0ABS8Z2Y5_9PSEU|nr:BTAD domain-containing putative transcriptional regulator [Kibdelosporangium philippinense]MCE7002296.1 winged helix-turn-helix domain-containing protein [Kibdelosporangium philippinense]